MQFLKESKIVYRITLTIVALLMVVMSFNHGITGDEDDASAYGKAIISYITTLGEDTTALSMPKALDQDQILHLYGGAFDMMAALVHKILPFLNEFTLRHILNALMGFLGIFFASRIVLLFSNYRAALVVVLLMFLFPFYLGHSMNNPKDVPFAAAYIMSIYFIIRFWQRYPKLKITDYVYIIVSVALALNIRIAALLLFAYSGLWLLMSILPEYKKNLSKIVNLKTILTFLGISLASYLLAVLFWPYGLQAPFTNPFIALETFSNLQISLAQTWEGVRVPSAELPWYYTPKSVLMTSTYVFLFGLLLAFVFLYGYRKNKNFWLLVFVGITGFFPIFYVVYKDSNVFHLWRHILFSFPSMAIIAAFGWERLMSFTETKSIKPIQWAAPILLVVLLCDPIIFIAKNQPNEVNYYNAIVGGPEEAYKNYEFDYYYNGLKPSVEYFKNNIAAKLKSSDTITLTTNAYHLMIKYLEDYPNVKIKYNRYYELNESEWDYNILHKALVPQAKLVSGSWLPSKHTLFTNQMGDLALSAVIKRPSRQNIVAANLLKEGKTDEAIIAYENYLKEDPNNMDIQKKVAQIYLQKNDIPKATAAITKVYQAEPDDLETKQVMGMIALRNNDPSTALRLYNEILTAQPQYIAAYFYIAQAQQALGQTEQALNSFNTAAQVPQFTAACYKAMGDIYRQLGNQEQAQKLYNLSQQRSQ